ncbi:T9SS sorting signal type C domain-containing protein [Flavobacterium psychrotrophum]|uniref:T9SS sorting signal type C domain-containing protein n=1 Tax=Flavobacterium psychrotrophum TaxID=2294119 RepID=UPI000E3123E0|nr:T9SS sorting signal type C domain-containing protein [Flavobacterium psychrotrophum]
MAGYAANPSDTTTSTSGLGSFYSGNNSSWVIAQGQGFIVKTVANVNNPVLKFNNSMRRASAASQAFFRQGQGSASKLWLNVKAPDAGAAQALVAYMDGATTGLDYALDATGLNDAATIGLYSIAENTKLAIQARPGFTATDVVTMGFTAPTSGQYTISIDHTEGIFTQGQAIYLKDNTEGITRNITDREYTFTSEAGTFENRFEVVYTTTALDTDNPVLNVEAVMVYKQGTGININTGSTLINSVAVYDISGRQLYSKENINATETVLNNLSVAQQVLIVEVTTPKGKVSKRIVY